MRGFSDQQNWVG
jgi:hypothetical protein